MKKIMLIIIAVICCLGLVACNNEQPKEEIPPVTAQSFTITFVQEGYEDIVKVLENGQTLKDIPLPKQAEGYTVGWSLTEEQIKGLTATTTVTAIAVANEYVISYDLGENPTAVNPTATKVEFGKPFTLAVPSDGQWLKFQNWALKDSGQVFSSGVYNLTKDITLVAVWENVKRTVTFVQQGQEDVVKHVVKGQPLTDIPLPKNTETGYTWAWESINLSAVTEDITVRAVKTANQYTVTFYINKAKYQDATLESYSIKVNYGAQFSLPTPKSKDYSFVSWVIKGSTQVVTGGAYNYASDITLEAVMSANWTENFT